MKTIEIFIKELLDAGVELRVEKGNLHLSAAKGVLTASLRARIKQHKEDILSYLEMVNPQSGNASIQVGVRPDHLPLSFAQQRLLFHYHLQGPSADYNMTMALKLQGHLDIAALRQSFSQIVRRHEVLRTVFVERQGEQVQEILANGSFDLSVHEVPSEWTPTQLVETLKNNALKPFHLERETPLRAELWRSEPDTYFLLMSLHHIAGDGWSMGIFAREFSEIYGALLEERDPVLPELPVQYADFALWQRRELAQPGTLDQHLAYWKKQLHGAPTVLPLPFDRPRPAVQTFAANDCPFHLAATTTNRLEAIAQDAGTTLYALLSAAFALLLGRYSDRDELLIGSPIANRNHWEVEDLIGFFVNTFVTRVRLAKTATFRQLLDQVKATTQDAFCHQDLPFERLVEALQPERNINRHPLVQVVFALQNAPQNELMLSGLDIAGIHLGHPRVRFDLEVQLWQEADGLRGPFIFNSDLFDKATIENMVAHFQYMLGKISDNADRLLHEYELVEESARRALLVTRNLHPSNGRCFMDLFDAIVAKFPEEPALLCGSDETISGHEPLSFRSYASLQAQVSKLAARLAYMGIGAETVTAIYATRTPASIVSILAVWRVGGAFLPLDPSYPRERLAYMVSDARPSLILTTHDTLEEDFFGVQSLKVQLSDEMAADDYPVYPLFSESQLAYVIYTSGTSGKPKGSLLTHAALVNLALDHHRHNLSPGARVLQFSSPSFDAFILELTMALGHGACLCLLDTEVMPLGAELDGLLENWAVSHIFLVPSVLSQLPSRPLPHLKLLISGGEACSPQLAQRLAGKGHQFINLYGPTETTVCATQLIYPGPGPTVPLGDPISGVELLVLDPAGQPLPRGIPGELCLGGAGVGRGYLGLPALTAQRFVPHPMCDVPGSRIYRSGDLVCRRASGDLDFLGRIDYQVKLRGFRIELDEINSLLVEVPGLLDAVTLLRKDRPGDKRLVSYVIPEPFVTSNRGLQPTGQNPTGPPSSQESKAQITSSHHRRASYAQHIAEWRDIYDDLLAQPGDFEDPELNISGWQDSFTGLPIPQEEMAEWLHHTVDHILEQAPNRVLEIGCGTGMILFRVAPQATLYHGIDISRGKLDYVTRQMQASSKDFSHVDLQQVPADQFQGFESDAYDTLILNSVVQYFPDAYYLLEVLNKAIAATARGGRIYLGDLRCEPMLEMYHASLLWPDAEDELTLSELRGRIFESISHEVELAINPVFFQLLKQSYPKIGRVEIQLKQGRRRNELTRFRYDVILHMGNRLADAENPRYSDWHQEGWTNTKLGEAMEKKPAILAISGAPNARLGYEAALLSGLRTRDIATAADLRAFLDAPAKLAEIKNGAVDPQDLRDLAATYNYDIQIGWSQACSEGEFDVVFRRRPSTITIDGAHMACKELTATQSEALCALVNNPLGAKFKRELIPRLRKVLQQKLPDYAVPSAIIVMDRFPLTPNGKLDREALPIPENTGTLATEYAEPATATEQAVAYSWQEVLGLGIIDRQANFFEIGGHSLQAARVVSRLRERLGVKLPLRTLFERPTIAGLAGFIALDAGQELPSRAPERPALKPFHGSGEPPLSFAQRRMWVLNHLEGASAVYVMPAWLYLNGVIDVTALERALGEIIRRHETMRTTFPEVDGHVRIVTLAPSPFRLQVVDQTDVGEKTVEALASKEAHQPFALNAEPPLRLKLWRLGQDAHLLLASMHHICSDGWSIGIFVRELSELYAAFVKDASSPLQPLKLQYGDYARWQHQWLQADVLKKQEKYWKDKLAGAPSLLRLNYDRPRPPQQSFQGNKHHFQIDPQQTGRLTQLARASNTSLFMCLHAAFATLLFRSSGQQDLLVGTPVANRPNPQLEVLIGFFVNTLVLRTVLQPSQSFETLLASVAAVDLEAFENEDIPYELVVEAMQPKRDLGYNPLFQVMFSMPNMPTTKLQLPGLSLEDKAVSTPTAMFDLSLMIVETQAGLQGSFQYSTDLFEARSMARMSGHFQVLLDAITQDSTQRLADLAFLTTVEKEQLLYEWNPVTAGSPPDNCLHELFEAWVSDIPDAIALIFGNHRLTYAELNSQSNRLAKDLRDLGVGPEVAVGVCCQRSIQMIVGLMAVLKAGGFYVPLDPTYPPERLRFMMEDANISVLLAQESGKDDSELPVFNLDQVCTLSAVNVPSTPNSAITDDHAAYMMYTSGSTGQPKGVVITHGNCALLMNSLTEILAEAECMLASGSVSFDVSVFQLFGPLCTGARVLLVDNIMDLATTPQRHEVTVISSVPSAMIELLRSCALPSDLRVVCLGGEPISDDLVNRIYQHKSVKSFFNLYGPTEDTVTSISALLKKNTAVTIGRPTAHRQSYVLDRQFHLLPSGAIGELVLAGAGLARGYHNQPGLTADRFRPNPFASIPGARLYRSLDLARYQRDGQICFAGRVDDQIKLHGYRIELGEIEAVISLHTCIQKAAVVIRGKESEDRADHILVAFLQLKDGYSQAAQVEKLRTFLRKRLPHYMVPSQFVVLAQMPLNSSEKVDRGALPQTCFSEPAMAPAFAAPSDELEQQISRIWCEALNLPSVGTADNFFDLGGNSLKLFRVRSLLQTALHREIRIVDLFTHTNISGLATFLRGENRDDPAMQVQTVAKSASDRLAVIAMSGCFPEAPSVSQLWDNLKKGRESLTRFDKQELLAAGLEESLFERPDYVAVRGVIQDASLFDAAFFGYTPGEARLIDPQQRLFLEHAYAAMELAGYGGESCQGRVSVFAGASQPGYLYNNIIPYMSSEAGRYESQLQVMIGMGADFLTTRTSYKLNLKGISTNVQSACSTSLVAIHLAVESLLHGSSDLALAGGVSVACPQKSGYFYVEGSAMSVNGHCRAFDAQAQGTVPGSGVGIVVLKRLAEASSDGDTIHAVIRGSAVNNDGSGRAGFTAPSVEGQDAVITRAQAVAGVSPETIGYVECHGTGTVLGDPIEVEALTRVFRRATDQRQYCAIGSVKTNVGHLDAAAGVTGFIKAVLAVKHGQIPASLHYERANPVIDFTSSPFFVNTQLRDWQNGDTPRRAGVSSFGLGGTNAHVIVEQPPEREPRPPSKPPYLLLLSAKTADALKAARQNLGAWFGRNPGASLADACFTLKVGRRAFSHRAMLVCQNAAEAEKYLAAAEGPKLGLVKDKPSIVFMFPEPDTMQVNMGKELYQNEPVFRDCINACAKLLASHHPMDLPACLYGDRQEKTHHPCENITELSVSAFAVSYAGARQWLSWGVRPTLMIGHGTGEYVAAVLAGVLSLEDALRLLVFRGEIFQRLPEGGSLSLFLAEEAVTPLLIEGTFLARINGPNDCVVSGLASALKTLEESLKQRGIPCNRGPHVRPLYCPLLEPVCDAFREFVGGLQLNPPRMPWFSCLRGAPISAQDAMDPHYWTSQLCKPVLFSQATKTLLADPRRVFLEIGPESGLTSLILRNPWRRAQQPAFSSLSHGQSAQSDRTHCLETLGCLWLTGAEVDWTGFYQGQQRGRIELPTYSFQRRSHWLETPKQTDEGSPRHRPVSRRPDQGRSRTHAPTTSLPHKPEQKIRAIWTSILGIEDIGPHDNFFELGGNSVIAIQILAKLREVFQIPLPIKALLDAPTIARLARTVAAMKQESQSLQPASDTSHAPLSCLVELREGHNAVPPLFLVHPVGGSAFIYRPLVEHLEIDQPVYGIQVRGIDGSEDLHESIEAMAADYVEQIIEVQPNGPYYLGGTSFGGLVVFEMARQLHAVGERVALLCLIDTPAPNDIEVLHDESGILIYNLGVMDPGQEGMSKDEFAQLDLEAQREYFLDHFMDSEEASTQDARQLYRRLLQIWQVNAQAFSKYQAQVYPGEIVFFRAKTRRDGYDPANPELAWMELARDGVMTHVIPGNHVTINQDPNIAILAKYLAKYLDGANRA